MATANEYEEGPTAMTTAPTTSSTTGPTMKTSTPTHSKSDMDTMFSRGALTDAELNAQIDSLIARNELERSKVKNQSSSKRKCNPETWHPNLAKKAHNLGEEYDSVVTNKTVDASLMPAFTRICENKGNAGSIFKQRCIKPESAEELKTKVYREFSISYGQEEGLEIRKLNMNVQHKDKQHKVQKLSIGKPTNAQTKVILLVGATGSGKTTLINCMVNYIYRVQFTDTFRFILIDDKNAEKKDNSESQTDLITAYFFHYMDGMPFDYTYILIDTPGFGDTRGIQRDKEMMKQLEMFLKQSYGIDSVDGVGFVTPSSAARLTHTQRYVYEGLSSMFGKDIKDNIYVMATFADAKAPPVLPALKEAKVNYAGFYKFNNSALFAKNSCDENTYEDSDSDEDDTVYMSKLFWEMGFKSMNNFFIKLGKTKPASLTLTKEVLGERSKLEIIIHGLKNQIQVGLGKLANLNQERQMLNNLNDNMKGCENYTEVVEIPKVESISIPEGTHVTNCKKCAHTCHYPCIYDNNEDKIKCWAMTDKYCRVCPEKCFWDEHVNTGFQYKYSWVKETRTLQDLLDRYTKAKQGIPSKKQAVKAISDDINNSTRALIDMIQEAQKHVERLEEIALKPNPLSTKEYIELMIESEKMQKSHNYEKRIQVLDKLKNEVAILKGVKGQPQASRGQDLLIYFQNIMNE